MTTPVACVHNGLVDSRTPKQGEAGSAFSCPRTVVVSMPFPALDCGCPAQPAYTLRKGTHEPMLVCKHHGDRLKAEAIRQGFVVTELKVPA